MCVCVCDCECEGGGETNSFLPSFSLPPTHGRLESSALKGRGERGKRRRKMLCGGRLVQSLPPSSAFCPKCFSPSLLLVFFYYSSLSPSPNQGGSRIAPALAKKVVNIPADNGLPSSSSLLLLSPPPPPPQLFFPSPGVCVHILQTGSVDGSKKSFEDSLVWHGEERGTCVMPLRRDASLACSKPDLDFFFQTSVQLLYFFKCIKVSRKGKNFRTSGFFWHCLTYHLTWFEILYDFWFFFRT